MSKLVRCKWLGLDFGPRSDLQMSAPAAQSSLIGACNPATPTFPNPFVRLRCSSARASACPRSFQSSTTQTSSVIKVAIVFDHSRAFPSSLHPPPKPCVLLSTHAYRVLIGACIRCYAQFFRRRRPGRGVLLRFERDLPLPAPDLGGLRHPGVRALARGRGSVWQGQLRERRHRCQRWSEQPRPA